MASSSAIAAGMRALEDLLGRRLPERLRGGGVGARVQLLGSNDLKKKDQGSLVGLYVHRIVVDPTGRNQPRPGGPGSPSRPVLPLVARFLLITWAAGAVAELELHAWALAELEGTQLDHGAIASLDPAFGDDEKLQVVVDELTTEDLGRIWDMLPSKYSLSSALALRTVRVERTVRESFPPVTVRALVMEDV